LYKIILLFFIPVVFYAQSGKLINIVDGDTIVLSTKGKNIICQMGEIDTPEIVLNSKLKREMKECNFSKDKFIKLGNISHNFAKSILKIGQTYEYYVYDYTRSKNPICKIKLPKGLRVEIRPTFDEIMVSEGYALPYVVKSKPDQLKLFLKIAKDAKQQKYGLWKENYDLMQCLVEHRYSLRTLR